MKVYLALFYSYLGSRPAKTYLKKAGLVETTRRGYFQITERGRKILENNPNLIDNQFLKQFWETG
ncbi:MAG: hypothetical protein GVY17_00005 [Cyanobacteria bacterium]|nr:hypothetical protein [Cyanobacteria bacterium GSL.Bin21]